MTLLTFSFDTLAAVTTLRPVFLKTVGRGMNENPPYLASPGSVTKSLERIRTAAAPDRFTSDFVATVLGFKGGAGRALIPFYNIREWDL